MSTRAIRALRGDAASLIPSTAADVTEEDADDDSDEEEEEEEEMSTQRRAAFTMLNDDDSEDDDDDESDNDINKEYKKENEECNESNTHGLSSDTRQQAVKSKTVDRSDSNNGEIDTNIDREENEDIDAILSEFQEKDLVGETGDLNDDSNDGTQRSSSISTKLPFDGIVANMDLRDFDYQYTMRTSILHFGAGQMEDDNELPRGSGIRPSKVTTNQNLFGPPMDGWIRPPRYIGGGMGMFSYDDRSSSSDGATVSPPWPYDNINEDESTSSSTIVLNPKRCYTFQRSEKAKRDVQDYFSIQQSNGDINMLVMFIAHHPYVPEALLQLSNVLYQTNHTAEGYAMLRRCLYVFETSFHINFINHVVLQERTYFIDMYYRNENRIFFQALFRYIQISHIAGYVLWNNGFPVKIHLIRTNSSYHSLLHYFPSQNQFESNGIGIMSIAFVLGSIT
jgi:Transcriptional repressor TCF25